MGTLSKKGEYYISTDKNDLNVDIIHHFLSKYSYWAQGRSREVVEKSIDHSAACFGLYKGEPKEKELIGFARVISDLATFAYLADIFVLQAHRGKGLAKWLVESVMSAEELSTVRKFMLTTVDAQSLYERYGFTVVKNPEWIMEKFTNGHYIKSKML
jgi:N-acetylglutamate synthase-like GNAT family acetyltransferase